MDGFTFQLAYGALVAVLIGLSMFILGRGLRLREYLRPLIYGFFLTVCFWVLFHIMPIIAFLTGGCLMGFLVARNVKGWTKHFRVGGLLGALIIPNFLYVPIANYVSLNGPEKIAAHISAKVGRVVGINEIFISLCAETIITIVFLFLLVGFGAVIGGMLRKLLRPDKQPSTQK